MAPFLQLAVSFFRVGLSAYGGGIAAIALIRHEVVDLRGWLVDAEFVRMVTLAEMTPGPLAVNTATYVGFQLAGFLGSLVATVAVLTPSMLILGVALLVSGRIRQALPIQHAVKPAVLALIAFALLSFGQSALTGPITIMIAVTALLVLVLTRRRVHPVLVVLAGGVFGVILL